MSQQHMTNMRANCHQARHVTAAYDKHACKLSLLHTQGLTASVLRTRTATNKRLKTAACRSSNLYGAEYAGGVSAMPQDRNSEDMLGCEQGRAGCARPVTHRAPCPQTLLHSQNAVNKRLNINGYIVLSSYLMSG